uniref:histidine kinase n=2 Tax=Cicer arietinum TaxID=3827 RepID=A0A1S2XXG3_CICAR|nr:histidine kinase CKI1-like [Cicer arietinum]
MGLLRPSSFIILLAYGVLIVLASLTPCWYVMDTHIQKSVDLLSENIVSQLQSEIEYSTELLNSMKSSSANFTTLLNSTLNSTKISFSNVDTKVAPLLFQALVTIPYLTQISYIGMEGLFFTYYNVDGQTLAMYSNSSSNGSASNKTLYYIQPVNSENGEVYGEAIIYNNTINASWINGTKNISHDFTSLGTKWNHDYDLLFINSARIEIGVISLGFSTNAIMDYISRIDDRQGTRWYLITKDGKVIVQGFQNISLMINNDDSVSFQHVDANGVLIRNEGNVSCKDEVDGSTLNLEDTQYLIHCYPIDLMGIKSVYVSAIPQDGFLSFDLTYKEKGLILVIVMIVMIFMAVMSCVFMNVGVTRREMHLCASLIKQMEATEQAERKNMNKSLALASASHDVRAYLAGLVGLIEMSYKLVVSASDLDTNLKPHSELETNLKQMENCTQDLLGLLNSILDTSKIEAGKMQLDEEEFDISYLLEDVVDLYHPMAMKKGVDLILDPCNGSVIKYSRVKGDRRKLKQVLCNLLSNAVKFTDEGHITVRAWTQKAKLQNSIMKSSKQFGFMKHLSCLFKKVNNKECEDIEAVNSIQQDPCFMDFIFEVDDTGKGIPKENYKSVFENYVQVKKNALGQVGTGLGLGIVQSLVRLMHGDIGIVDKEVGEKGTCFKFNVLLTLCETETVTYGLREGLDYGSTSWDRNQILTKTIHTATSAGSSFCSLSPKLQQFCNSPRPEPSHVVLYIGDEERRRTSQLFIESLGIKVEVVKHRKHLIHVLKKIKQKVHQISDQTSPESSDLSSRWTSYNSYSTRATRVPFRAMDGTTEYVSSVFKKTNIGAAPGFVLIIIDSNAEPFSKLCKIVSYFKKDLINPSKVVWLEKPFESNVDFKKLDQDDIVISKPFHGSRMFQVIKLLPEFGGNWRSNSSSKVIREFISQASLNDERLCVNVEQCCKGNQKIKAKKNSGNQGEIQECGGDSSYNQPLSGKKFLVVDDSDILCKIAKATLISLGVTSIDQCENGEEAVRLVDEGLIENSPYDYILMDCQMPVMDGFEATRKIREMEKHYGLHICIIALSAEIDKRTTETGMDFHITKPIKRDHLLKAIAYIENNHIM